MRGLITLVNDNHMANYLQAILAFVYYGSIVNNRPKIVIQSNFIGSTIFGAIEICSRYG